jgi:Glycine cleavage system T protein (aminomethyltransferase)
MLGNFLDYFFAGKLPPGGGISLSPMLTSGGKLYGDFPVACLPGAEFLIFGSGAARAMPRRWFGSHMSSFYVGYFGSSDDFHGISIAGP